MALRYPRLLCRSITKILEFLKFEELLQTFKIIWNTGPPRVIEEYLAFKSIYVLVRFETSVTDLKLCTGIGYG